MSNAAIHLTITDIIAKLDDLLNIIDLPDDVPAVTISTIIPFKDNPTFEIPEAWLNEWFLRYGELFVRKELVKCRSWCLDNPAKQKFCGKGSRPKGFIGGWLSRAAERSGHYVSKPSNNDKYARKVN